MVRSTKTDDAKTLLVIPFPMNYVIIDKLALNLVDICLDNTLQILCKSLLYFAAIGKHYYSKITKIWLLKFCTFNFKTVFLAQFLTDFNNLDLKFKLGYVLFTIKKFQKLNETFLFYC